MNILDFCKGDALFGGIHQPTYGEHVYELTEFKLQSVKACFREKYDAFDLYARLSLDDRITVTQNNLQEEKVYMDKNDYMVGVNDLKSRYTSDELISWISENYMLESECNYLVVYYWDDKRSAVVRTYLSYSWIERQNLLDFKIPSGYYKLKSECEEANRKMVKLEVVKKIIAVRDADKAELIAACPELYDFEDGDVVSIDASFAE